MFPFGLRVLHLRGTTLGLAHKNELFPESGALPLPLLGMFSLHMFSALKIRGYQAGLFFPTRCSRAPLAVHQAQKS